MENLSNFGESEKQKKFSEFEQRKKSLDKRMEELMMQSLRDTYDRSTFSCWSMDLFSIPKLQLPFFYSFLNNYTSYNTDQ